MADLDELAVAKARVMFKKVHASKIPAKEIDTWTVEELLCNSGIMTDGKLTRASIILLGKPVSVFKLRPAVIEVTWTLRDERQEVIDYEHFTAPFYPYRRSDIGQDTQPYHARTSRRNIVS